MSLATVVRAGDLFDNLSREDEQTSDREIEVSSNPKVEKLRRAFIDTLETSFTDALKKLNYIAARRIIYEEGITDKDIEQFSLSLSNIGRNYTGDPASFGFLAGEFFNWLITGAPHDEITLHTRYLENPLHNLTLSSRGALPPLYEKHLIVRGDVGCFLGKDMNGGRITVYGNAGSFLGSGMIRGEIIIKGSADWDIGSNMEGGIIRIEGNSDLRYLGQRRGGKIYVGGKKIK